MKAFKATVGEIFEPPVNGPDRVTVIAFCRENNQPVALATFSKHGYETDERNLENLPGQTTRAEIVQTARKTFWELQYIVRRSNFKSQCLGDIVLSCGLEKLGKLCEPRTTTNVWLIVSNSFLNSSAIRLYLSYGFQMSGMYKSALMMILFDLGQRSRTERAKSCMIRQVESAFVLPQLKNRSFQASGTSSTPMSSRVGQPSEQQVGLISFWRQHDTTMINLLRLFFSTISE